MSEQLDSSLPNSQPPSVAEVADLIKGCNLQPAQKDEIFKLLESQYPSADSLEIEPAEANPDVEVVPELDNAEGVEAASEVADDSVATEADDESVEKRLS